MVYRVIGLMSGSSLDGLDIVFAEFHESAGKWTYEIKASACYEYSAEWEQKLKGSVKLSALEYQLLHTSYGELTGQLVNRFINDNNLHYQVQLISSHGHTSFHLPAQKMTAQLGDGAAIAAITGINVVSDLRAMDIALGGQGTPIVPIGEMLLFPQNELLNAQNIETDIPSINCKQALNIALIGILRWREEYNVIASITGATKDSIGGAVWIGQDA